MIQVNMGLEGVGLKKKNPIALIQCIVRRKVLQTAHPFLQILES